MAAFTAIAAGVGVAAQGIGAIGAGRKARRARRAAAQAQARLAAAERSRQAITNPFAGVQDLSGMISNPFANLQVATQAAEMQADEADISLANTLDTLRATGAGSAGATALAQAALRSKQGVAASIEQQEAANSRLRAQGEQRAQQMRMAEAQRLQQADVAGRQFMFQTREQREMQKLNRLAGLSTQAQVNAQAASAQSTAALGALGGSLIGLAGSDAFSNAGGGNNTPVTAVNSITPSGIQPVLTGTGPVAPIFLGGN
jgi:hypothetical protein